MREKGLTLDHDAFDNSERLGIAPWPFYFSKNKKYGPNKIRSLSFYLFVLQNHPHVLHARLKSVSSLFV